MDACLAVEREVDKVLSKFNSIKDHSSRVLLDLANHIEDIQKELEILPPGHELTTQQAILLKQALTRVSDYAHRFATDHRDLHSTVSKVGKAIDRNFIAEFGSCSKGSVFNGREHSQLLDQVICQHFYRQGMIDIAQSIAKEGGLTMAEEQTKPFKEINGILNCLKEKDLTPALEWVQKNRAHLESLSSSLEFKLHQLRFITLIQKGVQYQSEAINYARTHFRPFGKRYEKEIQNLMGMFLYIPHGMDQSPYAHYFEPTFWAEIIEVFTRDACSLLGFSIDSPLSVSINAGCDALPALLNIKQVMQQRQVSGIWSGKDELPIEIDVGPDHQYHSIFACPILRQQSSDLNPPMRLVCGHVISKDALTKLSNSANKLKCPYCPVEQMTSEARQIYF